MSFFEEDFGGGAVSEAGVWSVVENVFDAPHLATF
jgi:hypothetical protein